MKKNTVFIIILTALITCLVTNTARDVMNARAYNGLSRKLQTVTEIIDTYSIYDLDENKAADMASKAIAAGTNDPYTAYYSKDEYSDFMTDIQSSYTGIGVVIGADSTLNKLVISSIFEGQTAEKNGLLAGDYIIAVNGVSYTGEQMNEAVSVIKGKNLKKIEGTTVTLTIERDGSVFDVTLPRETINRESVSSKILDNNIGYIRILQFSSKNSAIADSKDTYDEFIEHLTSLQNQKISSLIIDLRNNPGGDLEVVTKIADYLLPSGIITYTEDKNGKKTNYESDENSLNLPIVVLVNKDSASASEVLSGALKDYKKATLVGEKTYGKGVVQTVLPLYDGSGIRVTSAKYFTPSGKCIHEKGIEPDITVSLKTEKSISQLTPEEDLQLQKALEILTQ